MAETKRHASDQPLFFGQAKTHELHHQHTSHQHIDIFPSKSCSRLIAILEVYSSNKSLLNQDQNRRINTSEQFSARTLLSHSLGSLLFFRTLNMMKGISAFKKEGTGGVQTKASMRRGRKMLVQIYSLQCHFYSRMQLVTLYCHAMPSYRPTM